MAAVTVMPNFTQNISTKSDLVPEWSSQEVSTGVSVWFSVIGMDRTELGSIRVKSF